MSDFKKLEAELVEATIVAHSRRIVAAGSEVVAKTMMRAMASTEASSWSNDQVGGVIARIIEARRDADLAAAAAHCKERCAREFQMGVSQ